MSTPSWLAPPRPAKKLRGMLMTRAQGQLTTRKDRARYSQVPQSPSSPASRRTTGGSTARARAAAHTAGVYTRANLEMKFSDLDLWELEFSTSSRILDTVDSPKALVVRIFSTPVMLMQPLTISSPSVTSRGRLSPVRAAVFSVEEPSSTTPSSGTFSPGWTTITAPTGTSPGSTWVSWPSCSILA